MLLTPAEAKERECRSLPPQEDDILGVYQPKCIATGCMMWREQPLMADAPFLAAVAKYEKSAAVSHPAAVKHVKENRAEFGLPTAPFRGYCGLAGKPEG